MVMERGTVCWIAPDVATTVTVVVMVLGFDDPPHPVRAAVPMTAVARINNVGKWRRFL